MPKGEGIFLIPRTQPSTAYAASGPTRYPETIDGRTPTGLYITSLKTL